jgi:hypothetical protein
MTHCRRAIACCGSATRSAVRVRRQRALFAAHSTVSRTHSQMHGGCLARHAAGGRVGALVHVGRTPARPVALRARGFSHQYPERYCTGTIPEGIVSHVTCGTRTSESISSTCASARAVAQTQPDGARLIRGSGCAVRAGTRRGRRDLARPCDTATHRRGHVSARGSACRA